MFLPGLLLTRQYFSVQKNTDTLKNLQAPGSGRTFFDESVFHPFSFFRPVTIVFYCVVVSVELRRI